MRLAIARAGVSDGADGAHDGATGIELRFGEDVLLALEEPDWNALQQSSRGRSLRAIPHDVSAKNLHLVVQIGNMFQRQHPDVRVLLDRGRYLVVDLPPERAGELAAHRPCCYALRPIRSSGVVFDVRTPERLHGARAARVEALLDRLDEQRIHGDLLLLAAFPTRHSTSRGFEQAAEWVRGQLADAGYATRTEPVEVDGEASINVIADREGNAGASRGLVIVTAHLDSINSLGGTTSRAPGADDNGSGCAGLLALARALASARGSHDLRFIVFGGEEQGLYGSTQYVKALQSSDLSRIRAVINMDMIAGRNTDVPTVLIEGGPGRSQKLVENLARTATRYTSLTVQTSLEYFNSDHVPFIDAGLPAVLTIEGADRANARVHTERDTVDGIDRDLMREIISMNLAFIAETIDVVGES